MICNIKLNNFKCFEELCLLLDESVLARLNFSVAKKERLQR